MPEIFTLEELLDHQERQGEFCFAITASAAPPLGSSRYTPPSRSKESRQASANWAEDTLGSGKNDATNDVSIMMMFETPKGDLVLFTGDAGVRAFERAADDMDRVGFDAERLKYFQLPHHGSFGNVSSELLDTLLGPIAGSREAAEALASEKRRRCYAMTGSDDKHHPSQRVTNAAIRRGWKPFGTFGRSIRTHSGFHREGSTYQKNGSLEPIGFAESPRS